MNWSITRRRYELVARKTEVPCSFSVLMLNILNYKMRAVETPSKRFAVSLGRFRCLIEVTRSQTRRGRSSLVIIDLDRDTRSEGRCLQFLVLLHLHTLQITTELLQLYLIHNYRSRTWEKSRFTAQRMGLRHCVMRRYELKSCQKALIIIFSRHLANTIRAPPVSPVAVCSD